MNSNPDKIFAASDLKPVAILLIVAMLLGIWLTANTTIISKDGTRYIRQAQKLQDNPQKVTEAELLGYPLMILAAHKIIDTFTEKTDIYQWIYAGQAVTLLCRLGALAAIYFIGKIFVGSRLSFLAVLILTMLPYSARMGSDVLRDWPHMMFLAWGFLCMVAGAIKKNTVLFGLTGILAGLAHIIRPEGAQLVLYATAWVVIGLVFTKNQPKLKLAAMLAAIIAGFAIVAGPYMMAKGSVMPEKVRDVLSLDARQTGIVKQHPLPIERVYAKAGFGKDIVIATGKLAERVSEDLMYFFVPAMAIGLYIRFRHSGQMGNLADGQDGQTGGQVGRWAGGQVSAIERFFVLMLIAVNIAMMIALHVKYGYMSRRHCFGMVALTIFYVPQGLEAIAAWLEQRWPLDKTNRQKNQLWFKILLIAGLAICAGKLAGFGRVQKTGFIEAARWIENNTAETAVIAEPDWRISFYAGRKGLQTNDEKTIPQMAGYIVRIAKDAGEKEPADATTTAATLQEKAWFWLDSSRKKNKLVIYQVKQQD